jgi:signal transduction histidine kinase
MNKTVDTIHKFRDHQLTWGLRALSVAGFFVLLISLSRAISVGWHWVMALHIFLYIVVLSTALLSHRLSFSFRAGVIVGVPLLVGVTGLLQWGLAASGLHALFTYCILSTILFGSRSGIVAAVVSIAVTGIVGCLFASGTLVLDFDPRLYLTSYAPWGVAIAGIAVSAGLLVTALGTLNRQVEDLVRTLENRNEEMTTIIANLEDEMAERARAEAERVALAERLERAKRMEAIGTLAGGVAHDLNNILIGAVSYPDLLLTQLPENSPLRKPMETIKHSGVKAAAIVQDLLTLARRGVMAAEPINLNAVITDYFTSPEYEKLKSFHPRVEVELELAPDLPNILGSSIHLLKTVMNLVSNAAEAITDGGRIVVSTDHSHTGVRAGAFNDIEKGDYVTLKISDTGIGISPEEKEKVFEPFYTKKRMGRSGTGLGMAVVWGTVQDHKGYIDIDSAVGKGTTFTLCFPITMENKKAVPGISDAGEYMGGGESILIVDDVKEQREIAAEMLRELGYSVHAVASGEEAVAYLKVSAADLLMLDMYMEPGMDGLDTYRRALKIRPRQKAVITSGYAETPRVKEAQKLGAGTCLRKPFLLNVVAAAIRSELQK